jgi:cell division protein FtsB
MRRLPFYLLVVCLLLTWPIVSGMWTIHQAKKKIALQEKANQELIYRNAALQGDIEDLRQGNDAVQELARLQLGMVKTDEVFVQVMSQVPTPNAPAGTNAAPAR